MKKFFTAVFKFFIGCILCILMALILWSVLRLRLRFEQPIFVLACLGGILVGMAFFIKFHLTPIYVFGHEMTHWLIAKLFRRRTSRFTVHLSSGSVRVENPNIFIVLGPYIIPFYLLIACLVCVPVALFVQLPYWGRLAIAALLGLLYAYHLTLTWIALKSGQPDLAFYGPCFSLLFIAFFNLLTLYLIIALGAGELKEALLEPCRLLLNLCQRVLPAHAQAS